MVAVGHVHNSPHKRLTTCAECTQLCRGARNSINATSKVITATVAPQHFLTFW